jgi:AraC-like DNA-binding protein
MGKSTDFDYIRLDKNPWPEYLCASYRSFRENERHITRIPSHYVLIFMLERRLFFSEEGREIELRDGEWYVQMPGLLQHGSQESPAPSYFYIHFNAAGEGLDKINYDFSHNPEESSSIFLLKSGSYDKLLLKPLFDQLDYLDKSKPYDMLSRQALFLSILKHITSFHHREEQGGLGWEITHFISENYNKALTNDLLSEHFHFSAEYIIRTLKAYSGLTPGQYLSQYRITRAKEFLTNTNHTLSCIALEVGYHDTTVFYKAFKKQTGISPGEWRKRSRGINISR